MDGDETRCIHKSLSWPHNQIIHSFIQLLSSIILAHYHLHIIDNTSPSHFSQLPHWRAHKRIQNINMGKLLSKIFGNKEMRILMLGLDAAGKTSILFLKKNKPRTHHPTHDEFQFTFYENNHLFSLTLNPFNY